MRTLALGLLILPSQTASHAANPSGDVALTATTSLVSQYMFRGQRLNGAGLQPSVELATGNLALGVWSNVPLDDKVPDSSDPEIDLYGSYSIALNDRVNVVPGFTSYHFPSAPTNAGFYRATFEPSLAVDINGPGFRFTPKVYYDVVLDGATYELSAFFAYPLTAYGTELDFTFTAGTYKIKDAANDTSPAVKLWGDYWLAGVSLPFQFAANQRLTIGFAYTEGRDAFAKQGTLPRTPNALAAGRGVVSLSYAYSF